MATLPSSIAMQRGELLRLVLGSRSPRRLELLRQVHPAELIDVVPPSSVDEASFEGLHEWPSIEGRLIEIARVKCNDVADQLRRRTPRRKASDLVDRLVVIAADTVVIVSRAGGTLHVLGQPPEDSSWPDTVRRWFLEDYAGKTHTVATAVCLFPTDWTAVSEAHPATPRQVRSRVVTSQVTFVNDVQRWLDWYLQTGEPRGKAGGYALQGAGSLFVSRVEGSLSNVVGIPLTETLEMLAALA